MEKLNGDGQQPLLKVLLVDDEYMVLDTLLSSIRWDKLDMEVIATAMNGRQALEKCALHQPDLIVTDLTMPVMNGLELMETLGRDFPRVRFAVLTAHKDFEYAQRALEMKALGYLLKTPMNSEDIERTLANCADSVRLEQRQQRHLHRADQIKAQHIWEMRRRLLDDLLRGMHIAEELTADVFPWLDSRQERQPGFLAVYMTLEQRNRFFHRYPEADHSLLDYTMRQAALETIHELGSGTVLPYAQGELILILGLPAGAGKAQADTLLQHVCDRLYQWFHKYFGVSARFGIGEPAADFSGLKRTVQQAISAAEAAFYEPDQVHYHYRMAERIWNTVEPADWERLERRMRATWGSVSVEDRLEGLKEMREYVSNNRPLPREWKQKAALWLEGIPSVTVQRSDWAQLADNASMDIWFEALERILTRVPRSEPHIYDELHPEIHKAIQFIYEHLSENLTLSRVAEHIHMNPSYLSYLFKEETGENFLDFITVQRINKAKEYLASAKFKNYELAEKIGFQSYPHFCTVFKKLTGLTPSEYKNNATK